MPYRKQLFVNKYDNLQDMIDVDDSRGKSVPINMNFIEEGYITKDTGFEYFSDEDDTLRHSLFHYKKKNGVSYIVSAKDSKLQSHNHARKVVVNASSNLFTLNAHKLANNDRIKVWSTEELPGGTDAEKEYFVINANTNDLQISETEGGASIGISSVGSGEIYIKPQRKGWEDFTETWTAGHEFGFKVYDDFLWGGNAKDDYFKFDGTSFTKYPNAPKGNVFEIFEDQMFVTGVKNNPGAYYYSKIGDASDFTDTTRIIAPLGTDAAMTMKNYYGALLLFKRESIWKVTFQYDQIVNLFVPKVVVQSKTYGACSKDAVTWVENDIWFFTGRELRALGFTENQSGTFGVNNSVISESIKETLKLIEPKNFHKIKAFYANSKYYLAVPIKSDENNTLFVNHLLYKRRWTKYIGRKKAHINSFMKIDDDIFSSVNTVPYRIIKWSDALNDGDDAISSEVFFRRIEDPLFNRFRIYRYIDLKFKDLIATVRLIIKSEANDQSIKIIKDSYIGYAKETMENALGEVPAGQSLVADSFGENVEFSPFIKKRGSFLAKAQALIVGISNNKKNETFTLSEFILLGYEEPRRTFSGRRIIGMK